MLKMDFFRTPTIGFLSDDNFDWLLRLISPSGNRMLRLCLDLNIWVAALLADRKGRTNTGSQYLVEIVRSGSY
jgi:hypothetical protein